MPTVEECARLASHPWFGSLAAWFRRDIFEKACAECVIKCRFLGVWFDKVPFDEFEQVFKYVVRKRHIPITETTAEFGTHTVKREASVRFAMVVAFGMPLGFKFRHRRHESLQ